MTKINDFTLKPGELLPEDVKNKLQKANDAYTKSKSFPQYLKDLSAIFPVLEPKISTESNFYLGGFLEGEASLNVSAKKLKTAKFGIMVDPEFSITQHVNGFQNLYLALKTLQAGRVRHKGGSNATLVLIIDNRQTLEEKVITFFEKYVEPYSSPEKVRRVKTFKRLLALFNSDAHQKQSSFENEILPIWDQMRKQKGQANEAFKDLQEAQEACGSVKNHLKNKEKSRFPRDYTSSCLDKL